MARAGGRGRSGDSGVRVTSQGVLLVLARAALLTALVYIYAPSLRFGPISLDDAGQLALAAEQNFDPIWDADRYGHVRPIKSALFQWWARSPTDWGAVRSALLALFVLATVLVERLGARVTGSPLLGVFVAACWALHPVLPASVAWLSAVHGVLCLLGLLAYLECAERAIGAAPRASYTWLALALLSLGFALLSQQLAVIAPLLVWLRMREAPNGRALGRVLIGSALLIAAWLAIVAASASLVAPYRSSEHPAWLMSASAARYVMQHALWWLAPAQHFGVLLGDKPEAHLIASAASWLLLIAACALAFRRRGRDPVLVFGLAWFLIAIAPFSNLLPLGNTPLGMHYLLVPSIGLALVCVHALARIVAHFPKLLALPWVLGAALALYALPATTRAVAAFGDDEQLFARTVENHPDQIEPLVNLASAQLARGRYAAAAATLERARELEPENVGVVHNQFSLLWQTGELEAALALLDRHPRVAARPEFQLGRGQALLRLGRQREAVAPLRTAFEARSAAISADQRFVAGNQLVLALLQTKQEGEAEQLFLRMLAEYPEHPELRRMQGLWQR